MLLLFFDLACYNSNDELLKFLIFMYRFLLFVLFVVTLGGGVIWGTHVYFFAGQQPLVSYGQNISDDYFKDRVVVVLAASVPGDPENSIYLLNVLKAYQDKKISKIVVSGEKKEKQENRLLTIMDYFISKGVPEADLYPDFYSPEPFHTCRRLHEVFSIDKVIFVADHFRAQQALFACKYLGKLDAIAWAWPADEHLSDLFSAFKDELSVLADVYLIEPTVYLKDRPINIFAKLYPY